MEIESNVINVQKDSAGRKRPKQGNTQLFNEMLSASNALSVSERTRLCKSLAGQLGLVVVGSADLMKQAKPAAEGKAVVPPKEVNVRPNPLRGTQYELAKDQAYKALIEAKKAAGGEKLANDNPSVIAYATALNAYKSAHKALVPVGTPVVHPTGEATSTKRKVRTTTDRSPEPPVQGDSKNPPKRPSMIGALRAAVSSSSRG